MGAAAKPGPHHHAAWTLALVAMMATSLAAALAAELICEICTHQAHWRMNSFVIIVVIAIAFVGVLLAAPITHVFHGHHSRPGYSLYQPFIGGSTFIVLQIIGWTLYAATITAFLAIFYSVASALPFSSGVITWTVAGGVFATLSLWLSLYYFDANKNHQPFLRSLLYDGFALTVVALMYSAPIIFVVTAALPFVFITWTTYLAILVPLIFLYSGTYRERPHNSGSRSWPLIRDNIRIWSCFQHYFSYKLIHETKLDPNQVYMFGYHPHGIYPFTTVWGTRTSIWKNTFPSLNVDVLGASVLFYIPLVRDLAMWAGCRDATVTSIKQAYVERRSVMLVPGGEREMRENCPESAEIHLITRHRGFIREAIKNGFSLVPMFGFGESHLLDNFRAKEVQEWFSKRTLYGAPHMPYGRFYSPIPNAAPITVVVGEPIEVVRNPAPTTAQIDKLHRLYFDQLRDLFDRHKSSVEGFGHCRVVYTEFDHPIKSL